MKINDIKGKQVAIKCTTKEEMKQVGDLLHKYASWAYNSHLKLDAYDLGYIFVYISASGSYANSKGDQLITIGIKILASEFISNNKMGV